MTPASNVRLCYFCGVPMQARAAVCPQCGRTNKTPKQVRIIGWVLLSLGTFLIVFMGGLSVVVARIIAGTKNPEATARFTGSVGEAAVMYGVFSLVVMFGFAAAVSGWSQIRTGRANKRLLGAALAMGGALLVFGELLLLFF